MTDMLSQTAQPGEARQLSAAVVDDDPQILETLSKLLEIEGFEVRKFSDPHAALAAFQTAQPDIALIDLMMPGMDGMEMVKQVRIHWDFPVIMVTGGDDELDEALGLRLGADDYVHKPFAMRTLMERIRAALRRAQPRQAAAPEPEEAPEETADILERGALRIDPERHAVTWQGIPVTLTATEFQLLEALARRPGVVKSRDQLMDVAYSDQVYVDDRTIDSHIKRLRKKLRAVDPEFSAIETLYGIGYRFSNPEPAVSQA